MTVALGISALLVGALVVIGQAISVADFQLAQRLGLQERDGGAEALHHRLELAVARWDLLVFWTLPLAGVAMLSDASWWPWLALIAGAVCVDTGGREASKLLALRAQRVRIGTPQERRNLFGLHALLVALGLALIADSLVELA